MTTPEVARKAFAEYAIDVSRASDDDVVRAYDGVVTGAIVMSTSVGAIMRSVRILCDFQEQPKLNPKWNLNLNELLR